MHCTKKITSDLIWLGGSDRRLALFENVYPIPRGVSYNAYLIRDEKRPCWTRWTRPSRSGSLRIWNMPSRAGS